MIESRQPSLDEWARDEMVRSVLVLLGVGPGPYCPQLFDPLTSESYYPMIPPSATSCSLFFFPFNSATDYEFTRCKKSRLAALRDVRSCEHYAGRLRRSTVENSCSTYSDGPAMNDVIDADSAAV